MKPQENTPALFAAQRLTIRRTKWVACTMAITYAVMLTVAAIMTTQMGNATAEGLMIVAHVLSGATIASLSIWLFILWTQSRLESRA